MQITIGLGAATSFLVACSGGVLDVGSNDAGGREAAPATVESAAQVCQLLRNDMSAFDSLLNFALPRTTLPAAEFHSDLSGTWSVCEQFSDVPVRYFQFTSGGRWSALIDDGDGGLTRSPDAGSAVSIPGYRGPRMANEGTYTLQDAMGNPLAPDAGGVFVGTGGDAWFRPVFDTVLGQRVMVMEFTNASQDVCVFAGPWRSSTATPVSRLPPSSSLHRDSD